ncbi:MAG: hypothetical protein IPJ34_23895 [Myxococcales bacterium]|nr:hypothetical protein [Myxococcales bacterium]
MNARVAAPIAMALACVAAPSRADATADAEAAVTKAAADLDAIGASDCPALCKALASLETATKHLCALAKPGDEVDQKRCSDAKGKLEEATKKVRAKCPACAPAPPADLTNAPTNPPTNAPNKPAAVDHDGVSDSQAVGGCTSRPHRPSAPRTRADSRCSRSAGRRCASSRHRGSSLCPWSRRSARASRSASMAPTVATTGPRRGRSACSPGGSSLAPSRAACSSASTPARPTCPTKATCS